MMKFFVFAALVGIACAGSAYNAPNQYRAAKFGGAPSHASSYSSHASSGDDAHAEVKVLHSDVRADGFEYALETSNGIHAQSAGDAHGNVHGDYEYISPEGEHIKVTYVADENGYQPSGAHLPTPPPIPAAILKSLEYIRTHPAKEETHYGGRHH